MKFLFYFAFAWSVLGCQHSSKNLTDNNCSSVRDPAAFSAGLCSGVFLNSYLAKAPSEKELEVFFKDLEQFEMSQWNLLVVIEKNYSTKSHSKSFVESRIENSERRPLRSVSTAEVLAERRALNESTAKILTELGFRETAGHLMPPRNIPKFYKNIYERILSSAKDSGVAETDVILPAFLFSRQEKETNKQVLMFVRPGIDPLPKASDGWRLKLNGDELNSSDFQRMFREKKFLLDPGMFFHDIGHVVDFIERPHYMRAYREYIEKKAAIMEGEMPPALRPHVLGQVAYRGDIERYFNEWLYLPSEKNLSKIQEVIPQLEITDPATMGLSNVQGLYKNKTSKELLKTAKSFLKNRYTLFSSHGGGARDWSVERYLTPEFILRGFEEVLVDKGDAVDPLRLNAPTVEFKQNKDPAYRMNEAPGIFQRLEYLVDFKNGKPVPIEIREHLTKLAEHLNYKNIDSFVDYQMALHLAEVQYRIQIALFLKMTPEQIAADTSLLYEKKGWEKYQKSKTYKYYSTYKPYTVQWFLGYDVGRPIPGLEYVEWPQQ